MAAPKFREQSITDDTEVYYDLGIFGHDLYEFVVWVSKEFGIERRINLDEYGPRERMPPVLFRERRVRREREQGRYKSLKVRDILTAIESGHWPAATNPPLSTPQAEQE
jgi:hypothetical protein